MMNKVRIRAADKKDGRLISVTIQITDPSELKIYKKCLEGEEAFKKCPHCGQSNTVGDDDLQMRIDSPLAGNQILSAATPIMHCDHCGKMIDLSMMDYSAFPSVITFPHELKATSAQMQKGQ